MDHRPAHEMRQNRLRPVARDQEQKVGELGHALRAGLGEPARQRSAAMDQQAMDLLDPVGQPPAGAAVETGWDVLVIENDHPVRAHLAHPGDAHLHHRRGRLVGNLDSQVELADAQRHRPVVLAVGVPRVLVGGAIAQQRIVTVSQAQFGHPRPAQRQGQGDHGVLGVLGHVQRRRYRRIDRNIERRPVGHQAGDPRQSDLSQLQQLLVELDLAESVGIGEQGPGAPFEQALDVALLLLEMVGAKEDALRPDDLVVERHPIFPVVGFLRPALASRESSPSSDPD